jgi:hypothetical protein
MVSILRWTAVLPGALAGAWLGWFACNFVNRITLLFSGIWPDSFLGRLYIESVSSMVLGAAFVYAGASIAPMHQARAALLLGVIGLITAVVFAAAALPVSNYWALWGDIWFAFGVGAVGFSGAITSRLPPATSSS